MAPIDNGLTIKEMHPEFDSTLRTWGLRRFQIYSSEFVRHLNTGHFTRLEVSNLMAFDLQELEMSLQVWWRHEKGKRDQHLV